MFSLTYFLEGSEGYKLFRYSIYLYHKFYRDLDQVCFMFRVMRSKRDSSVIQAWLKRDSSVIPDITHFNAVFILFGTFFT